MHADIMRVVPSDASFNVDELLGWLEMDDSERGRVRTTIDRLINRRELKRVRRGRRGKPALFAVESFGPPTNPLNDMSQIDAAAAALREVGRPLSTTELVIEMKSRGYLPVSGDRALAKSLGREMGRNIRFLKEYAGWRVR